MEILNQLGELFLEAVPTIIIVFLFYVFLRWAFFNPIAKVMAERAARTEGARREAEEAKAAAEEKVRAYEEALKKARGTVYAEQDARRRAILDERAAMIREARKAATERVAAAKDRIAAEAATTRAQLEQQSPALAGEIVEAVFARRPGPGGSVQGGAR
jgi:F-type H+-transporting ATPase subunit b